MMMMVMIKMVNNVAEDDDEDLLAPAGQVHLHPDTLLLPPAKILGSVSKGETCSRCTNTGDGTQQIRKRNMRQIRANFLNKYWWCEACRLGGQ